MTLPRTITTLLLALVCLASACGGTETDVSDEPVDVTDPVEHTDEALRSRPGGPRGFSSCEAPAVTCYNENGKVIGVAAGCSRLCYDETAICLAGGCQGRVIIQSSCSCSPF